MMLFSMITAAQNGNAVSLMSRHFGFNNFQITHIIRQFIPVFMQGLETNFANRGGISSLLQAFDHKKFVHFYGDPEIYQNPQVRQSGMAIIGKVFGPEDDDQRAMLNRVYLATGVDVQNLQTLLPFIAVLTLSSLYRKAQMTLASGFSVPAQLPHQTSQTYMSEPPQKHPGYAEHNAMQAPIAHNQASSHHRSSHPVTVTPQKPQNSHQNSLQQAIRMADNKNHNEISQDNLYNIHNEPLPNIIVQAQAAYAKRMQRQQFHPKYWMRSQSQFTQSQAQFPQSQFAQPHLAQTHANQAQPAQAQFAQSQSVPTQTWQSKAVNVQSSPYQQPVAQAVTRPAQLPPQQIAQAHSMQKQFAGGQPSITSSYQAQEYRTQEHSAQDFKAADYKAPDYRAEGISSAMNLSQIKQTQFSEIQYARNGSGQNTHGQAGYQNTYNQAGYVQPQYRPANGYTHLATATAQAPVIARQQKHFQGHLPTQPNIQPAFRPAPRALPSRSDSSASSSLYGPEQVRTIHDNEPSFSNRDPIELNDSASHAPFQQRKYVSLREKLSNQLPWYDGI